MAKAPDQSPPTEADGRAAPAALRPFGVHPLRTFALAIALPTLLLFLACAAVLVFVLGNMAADIDRVEAERSAGQMHAALDSVLNDLSSNVADEGTWNEAYLSVVVNSDPAWMDNTWGASVRLGAAYDAVLVTDPTGSIVFGETSSGPIAGSIVDRFPAAKTMLVELDKGIATTGDATTVSHFTADRDGAAGLAAISIHQSTSAQTSVPKSVRKILWLARHITPDVMQNLAIRYQTPLATLVTSPTSEAATIELTDADGKPAGTIAWTPDTPGAAAFNRTLTTASTIFLLIGIAVVIALGMIRRAMLRRVAALDRTVAALERVHAVAAPVVVAPAPAAPVREPEIPPESTIAGVAAADFEIEYQPVFDLRAQAMIGAEALLRWRRPDRSILRQESLAASDVTTLFDRIGILALRRAADEMAPLPGMSLCVVVTPTQLMTPIFAEKVMGTLGATNFPARRLQLAVDTAALPPVHRLRDRLADLRQSGVAVALGDFVLSPSTSSYAEPGLVDRIRLPAINDIDADPVLAALVEASMSVAKSVGWAATAKGIERKDDASRLFSLGCRDFQGGLFSDPMPIEVLTSLVLRPPAQKAS